MTDRPDLDLQQEALRDMTARLIDTNSPEPFGLYVFESTEAGADLGRHVEREVFAEFFDNSPELLAEEYAPYEAASLFLVVIDHRRCLPAGVMRVIRPSDAGFKSLDDMERIWEQPLGEVVDRTGIDPDMGRVWDVATLAVTADYRGEKTSGLVSLALYQGLAMTALQCGVEWWVTILDVVVLDLIQTMTQKPFSYFRGIAPRRYLDSPSSVPVWCDIKTWARRIRRADASMFEILCEGRGLEAAVATPDWNEVAKVAGVGNPLEVASAR